MLLYLFRNRTQKAYEGSHESVAPFPVTQIRIICRCIFASAFYFLINIVLNIKVFSLFDFTTHIITL